VYLKKKVFVEFILSIIHVTLISFTNNQKDYLVFV